MLDEMLQREHVAEQVGAPAPALGVGGGIFDEKRVSTLDAGDPPADDVVRACSERGWQRGTLHVSRRDAGAPNPNGSARFVRRSRSTASRKLPDRKDHRQLVRHALGGHLDDPRRAGSRIASQRFRLRS